MTFRETYEKHEDSNLAPYAMRNSISRGKFHKEDKCPFRTAFQRDRDRVIHSEAFRRLEYKTQVFVNHEGDYYRTRLTHTLEVAQISRGLSRSLGLNEDLAEAIALAHDLGHTPFGHRGEEVLNKLMNNHDGFEHNRQSLRVVTLIEKRYPCFSGLNLSIEVLEGLAKHKTEFDIPAEMEFIDEGAPLLEAQVVNLADEIAYMNHDLDDGLKSGMLEFDSLMEVPFWKDVLLSVQKEFPNEREKIQRFQTIGKLIHLFVMDVQKETIKRIKIRKINSIDDARKNGDGVVSFSDETNLRVRECIDFLFEHLYRHYKVERMAQKSNRVLTDLFDIYLKSPRILPPRLFQAIMKNGNAHRFICDYIAGMTDRFALDEHSKLFDPKEAV